MIKDYARCTREMKSRKRHRKSSIQQKEGSFTRKLCLNLRKKLVKCYIWSTALYGAEILTFRKVDEKLLESFEMWCWRRMENRLDRLCKKRGSIT
jgi:hypothetical protein